MKLLLVAGKDVILVAYNRLLKIAHVKIARSGLHLFYFSFSFLFLIFIFLLIYFLFFYF